jgi:CTP synthase
VKSVYEMPLIFEKEGVPDIVLKKLRIYAPPQLEEWRKLVETCKRNLEHPRKTLKIAICGKYTNLEDSYASVMEAIYHSAAHLDLAAKIVMVDTEALEKKKQDPAKLLAGIDAVIVPGGFGGRGIEGKIRLIQYVRENSIPFLGICYGMQLAVVEWARHVMGLAGANTTEIEADGNVKVETPVVAYLPGQEHLRQKGGTMRLGGHDVLLKKGSLAERVYGSSKVRERFRHRYEVNPEFVPQLEQKGLVFSGQAANEDIMQVMEVEGHPYFIACQFHPELKSTLVKPAPLFLELLRAAAGG